MQRLMPMLDDGPPTPDLIGDILKVQARILRLHGLASDGRVGIHAPEDEAVVIAHTRAEAPVLRPDAPVPPGKCHRNTNTAPRT